MAETFPPEENSPKKVLSGRKLHFLVIEQRNVQKVVHGEGRGKLWGAILCFYGQEKCSADRERQEKGGGGGERCWIWFVDRRWRDAAAAAAAAVRWPCCCLLLLLPSFVHLFCFCSYTTLPGRLRRPQFRLIARDTAKKPPSFPWWKVLVKAGRSRAFRSTPPTPLRCIGEAQGNLNRWLLEEGMDLPPPPIFLPSRGKKNFPVQKRFPRQEDKKKCFSNYLHSDVRNTFFFYFLRSERRDDKKLQPHKKKCTRLFHTFPSCFNFIP